MAQYNEQPKSHLEMLEQISAPGIQSLAKMLAQVLPGKIDLKALPSRKGECIKLIYVALLNNEHLARVFNSLSTNEKQTISEIINQPGFEIDVARYEAIYGMMPAIPAYNSTIRLMHLFVTTTGVISPDLASRLELIALPLRTPMAVYLPEEPPISDELWFQATEQAACHDVLAMLNLIDQHTVKVSQATGIITEASAAPVRAGLLLGDYYAEHLEPEYSDDVLIGKRGIKPFAWAQLLQAAGLATNNGGKLTLSNAGMKARTKPAHEILQLIWMRWLKYKGFHEFSRLEEIKGQKSAQRPLYQPCDARSAIADSLAALEVNRWIAIDQFFTFLTAIGNDFSVVRNPWPLYHEDPQYGSFGYSNITWEHLDGRFAMAFLLEYCATLGIIDIAISTPWNSPRVDLSGLWGWDDKSCMSRYDGLQYLRLTTLGSWMLGVTDEYRPQRVSAPACLLREMDIVLLRPVEPLQLIQLERFAVKMTEENVFRLSKQKILQACDEGIALHEVTGMLLDMSEGELPEQVSALFHEIEKNLQKLALESAGYLIQCNDSDLLNTICGDPAAKKICLRLNDQLLFLSIGHEKAFRALLRKYDLILPVLPTGSA